MEIGNCKIIDAKIPVQIKREETKISFPILKSDDYKEIYESIKNYQFEEFINGGETGYQMWPVFTDIIYINEVELLTEVSLEIKHFDGAFLFFKTQNESENAIKSYNIPFLKQNTEDFKTLQNNKVIVPLKPSYKQPSFIITGALTGCSIIIGLGEEDMVIYHDGKPELNVVEKIKKLFDENRKIIRLDCKASKEIIESNLSDEKIQFDQYLYYDPTTSGEIVVNNVFLNYNWNTSKWEMIVQKITKTFSKDKRLIVVNNGYAVIIVQ